MARVHVIGAGLAGLASAVELTHRGVDVALYEAAGHAGGRCRSFFDATMNCEIDNGNHLLMSANDAARAYLARIGSLETMWSPEAASYPFLDLNTGERWNLAPNIGRFPWWIFKPERRVAGTGARHYLSGLRLPFAGPSRTVGQCLSKSNPLYERFWRPLTVAALNTQPEEASAAILWRVFAETFAKGGAGCVPMVARDGLGPSFVDPALAFLAARGTAVHFNARVRGFTMDDGRIAKIALGGGGGGGGGGGSGGAEDVSLGEADRVVLAVPPRAAASLVPDLGVPDQSRAIVNAHFRVSRVLTEPGEVDFLGLIGGAADWLFLRGDIASVTVSAADEMVEWDSAAIERALWRDTATALGLRDEQRMGARIIKEKRATFAQTPEQVARRAPARTGWANLVLAGDWTDTGLPATIEGTIRSAHAAVAALGLGLQ